MSRTFRTAIVTDDGHWSSSSEIITFDKDQLTEYQWKVLAEIPDYERIGYVEAILLGEDLYYWEMDG